MERRHNDGRSRSRSRSRDRRKKSPSGSSKRDSGRRGSSSSERKRSRSRDNDARRASDRKRPSREEDAGNYRWGKAEQDDESKDEKPKKAPKMQLGASGLLKEEALKNDVGAVVVYTGAPDGMKPDKQWMIFPFRGEDALEPINVSRKEWYLFGKDHDVADIRTDHLTCSRQHAVLQFRTRTSLDEYGDEVTKIRPYILDLNSSNGTFLNKMRLEPRVYVELRSQDMLSFGKSTRRYILINADDEIPK